MKQKDGHECISLDLYSNLLNEGCLYEGYVENCGYAFYECVPVLPMLIKPILFMIYVMFVN